MKFPSLSIPRPIYREFLIFLAFTLLTAMMTWPWLLQLRAAVPDTGDPYAISYFLWWDYHQTFHDPLNLFQATIFYPYHYSLAFSEYDYGVSLIFFPLFALGARPLTVYSIAAFLSFPFTGYATFRLARTLSGSTALAWIAGIIIAFLPFRFHHLAHLHLIFAGWIPLLFEALVLFSRGRTWGRASWLGVAFLMNGLTCTTWFILSIIPLSLSAILLLNRNRAWNDRKFWLRALAALGFASILLLPFYLPVRRVAAEQGFVRSAEEVSHYSARFINWLAADQRSRAWSGFGTSGAETDMVLFPGLLAPLLALAAFFLPGREKRKEESKSNTTGLRILLILLDVAAWTAAVIALLALGYDVLQLKLFGHLLLSASGPARALSILMVVLVIRCLIAYPRVLRTAMGGDRNLAESLGAPDRSELFGHALLWIAIGFAGSFGLNFFFHKFLFDHVSVFRAMRVATRWAMICYVGLALLAGLGAIRVAAMMKRRWPQFERFVVPLTYGLIVLAILVDLHATPLQMIRGQADPDQLTLDLKNRQMRGGIIELPIGDRDHVYMLRAADHGHPLVNGWDSFIPPLQREIAAMIAGPLVPEKLLDTLESIPVSYLTVHHALLSTEERTAIERFLNRGVATGRLRLVKSFAAAESEGSGQIDDLYVITRTEPNVKSEDQGSSTTTTPGVSANEASGSNPIDEPRFFVRMQYLDFLGREPDAAGWNYWAGRIQSCADSRCVDEQHVAVASAFLAEKEFQETGLFLYCLYKGTLGRPPSYEEFKADRAKVIGGANLQASKNAFAVEWIKRPQFRARYPAELKPDQFVDELLKTLVANSGLQLKVARQSLIDRLNQGSSRAELVQMMIDDDSFVRREDDRAFVSLQYFAFFKRDPDAAGYNFWLDALSKRTPETYHNIVRAFINSTEYRSRFVPKTTSK